VAKLLVPGTAVHRLHYKWTVCLPWRPSHSWLSKHRQFIRSTTHGLVKPPPGYEGTVTLVILSAFRTCHILTSPTTEPGRRGWKRRLGSPLSAPHFFARTSCPHLKESGASKPTFPCAPPCLLWFKLFPSTATSDADESATNLRDSPVWDRTENRELRTEHNRLTHPDHSPDNSHFAPRIQ